MWQIEREHMSTEPVSNSTLPSGMNEILQQIKPVVDEFVSFIEGKSSREVALKSFHKFMVITLPPPMRPSKDLATSILKSSITGFANIPQLMASMAVLLEE